MIKGTTTFGDSLLFIEVTHDPSQECTECPIGSIIGDANGIIYRKRSNTGNPSIDVIPLMDFLSSNFEETGPMGVPTLEETTINWDDTTKTFTLSPTGTDGFSVWVKGKQYTFLDDEILVGDGTDFTIAEGLWYFYFEEGGILTANQTPWNFELHAPVALLRWDATNSKAILFCDERHGVSMSWATHEYAHLTIRTRYQRGLALTGDITGDGDSDSHAQVSIADGVVRDEDLPIEIVDGTSGRFAQEIYPIAYIPIFYLNGATPVWRRTNANTFPLIQGTDRIKFNEYSGGSWQLTEAAKNGNYIAMWLFASNNRSVPSDGVTWEEPIIAILGQREDDNLVEARENNDFSSLVVPSDLIAEAKSIYRLIFQTSTTYSNTPHARLRDIEDLRSSLTILGGNNPTPSPVIYGTHRVYASSEEESTTTSTDWQSKVSRTTPTVPAGKYQVKWYWEYGGGFSRVVEAKIDVAGVEVGIDQFDPPDSDHWKSVGGMYEYALAADGTITAEISFRRVSSTTARIRRARFEIYRVE